VAEGPRSIVTGVISLALRGRGGYRKAQVAGNSGRLVLQTGRVDVQVGPSGLWERPRRFLADGGDGVAVGADLQSHGRQSGPVVAPEMLIEERQLGLSGFVGVEGDPLASTVGVEVTFSALDHLEATEGAPAVQVVVREAPAHEGRHRDLVAVGNE
jgi:hypothetical protein